MEDLAAELKPTPVWDGLTHQDWIEKIDATLGPNLTFIHTQGPEYPGREPDDEKREKMIREARIRLIGEMSEITWQMERNDFDDEIVEKTGDLLDYLISLDITDRDVRIFIQAHVENMHESP